MNAFDRPKPRQPTQAAEGLPRWRWTLEEFEKMAEFGLLTEYDRVELIGGELVPMSPKGPLHEGLRLWINQNLRFAVPPDLLILPEPGWRPDGSQYFEPDFLVVRESPKPFLTPANEVLLLIEVADTSVRFDMGTKASVFAALGVPEYWVVRAADRQIVVHREPDAQKGYASIVTVSAGQSATSQLIPDLSLSPTDLPKIDED